jgi:hypothetical protein
MFATWGVGLLFTLLPPLPHLPIGYDVQLNLSVLLFSAVMTLATGMLFGLAPALRALQTNLNDTLKQAGRTGAPNSQSSWLRNSFVISEIALALVLLIGMTLCSRSLQQPDKTRSDGTLIFGATIGAS